MTAIGNPEEGRSYGTNKKLNNEATIHLTKVYEEIFESFYRIVHSKASMKKPAMSFHYILRHMKFQKFTQRYHIDINEDDIVTFDKGFLPGSGFGFSAFVGMSDVNKMVVFDEGTGEKVITFGKGSILVLRYGCIHCGVKNVQSESTYKTFTAVGDKVIPNPDSQLWYIEKKFASSEWYQAEGNKDSYVPGYYVNKSCRDV